MVPNLPKVLMYLYQCANCVFVFAVEIHEDIDHSEVICPICHDDSGLTDVGCGEFEVTELADKEEEN